MLTAACRDNLTAVGALIATTSHTPNEKYLFDQMSKIEKDMEKVDDNFDVSFQQMDVEVAGRHHTLGRKRRREKPRNRDTVNAEAGKQKLSIIFFNFSEHLERVKISSLVEYPPSGTVIDFNLETSNHSLVVSFFRLWKGNVGRDMLALGASMSFTPSIIGHDISICCPCISASGL